jgi:hypothetical protein
MIYFTIDEGDRACLIIEAGNIARLKSGWVMTTPDGRFMICYTPDMDWTNDQFKAMLAIHKNIDAEILQFILKEGMKRQEVKR